MNAMFNAAITTRKRRTSRSCLWRLAGLIASAYLALLATPAMAACTGNGQAAGAVTFSPPATINLPANLSVGQTIWTSPPAVPGNSVTLNNCADNTTSGLENAKWGPPTGGDSTLFPTNYPWLSYRILHPDTTKLLHAWPNEPVPGGNIQFSVASELALVVTGTVPTGNHVLGGGQLTQWDVDIGGGSKQTVELFNITTSTITLVFPTCAIFIDPTVVTLPPVTAAALPNKGSTAGQVPFDLRLNCQTSSETLSVTLDTANQSGPNNRGAITPGGAGFAKRVGIQLLQGPACTTPVTWGQAISEGNPPTGPWNLPFCAQYYRTGNNPVTAGNVTGTATYTLSYQ